MKTLLLNILSPIVCAYYRFAHKGESTLRKVTLNASGQVTQVQVGWLRIKTTPFTVAKGQCIYVGLVDGEARVFTELGMRLV